MILSSLGIAHFELSQHEKSIDYHEKALAIFQKYKYRQGEGRVLSNMGNPYLRLGNTTKALELYTEAVDLHETTGDNAALAFALKNLGNAYSELCEFGKAITALRKALETRTLPEKDILDALEFLKVMEFLSNALALTTETLQMDAQRAVKDNTGWLELRRGNHAEALRSFRAAHALTRKLLQGLEMDLQVPALRSFIARRTGRHLTGYFTVLLSSMENAQPGRKKELVRESVQAVEDLRSRALANSVRAANLRRLLDTKSRAVWNRIFHLRREVAGLAYSKTLTDDERKQAFEEYGHKIDSLERELKATEPRYATLCSEVPKLDDEKLSTLFGAQEILLYYAFIGNRVAVFTRSAQAGLTVQVLDGGASDLKDKVERVCNHLKGREPIANLKQELSDLRTRLFPGIEGHLADAKRLTIVPDGILCRLPFEALVLENGDYLVERFAVRYAPSLHVILELQRREPVAARYELVAYGDPDFGPRARELKRGVKLPLSHARQEIADVSALFEPKRVLKRTERDAAEGSFKREAGLGSLLHVATHGEWAGKGSLRDPLFQPALFFAGYNEGGTGDKEDGVLTAAEVLALDLRAVELVVLSACETAAGELEEYEGKFSMERAFFAAGAGGFVGSLWKVYGKPTSDLMTEFHRRLRRGESAPDALRRVKLDLLRTESSSPEGGSGKADAGDSDERGGPTRASLPPSFHPYVWAPLVFSGQWSQK